MEYKKLTDTQKEVYKELLVGALGETDCFSEHGEPLYFNEDGKMLDHHDQVIQEMRNQGHISIMHIVKQTFG